MVSSPPQNPLATDQSGAIRFGSVMSASVKPRLAGRQPSNRGGVPRVMTRLSSPSRLRGKRGSVRTGPRETGKPDAEAHCVPLLLNPPQCAVVT